MLERRRQVAAVAALGALLLATSCGSDAAGRDPSAGRPDAWERSGSSESSPFAVGEVPEGFELLVAGTGMGQQIWGEDCCGTDQPFTILEQTDGDGAHVRVSIAGYEDTQGGFPQASRGYIDDATEELEVEGRMALWWPGVDPGEEDCCRSWLAWPELAVDEGDDLAVTVAGEGLSLDELEAIYRAVEVRDRATAPAVPEPPDGFQVVGAVDLEGELATRLRATSPEREPGGARTHSAGWRRDRQELAVATVPGRTLSLDALAAVVQGEGSTVELTEADGLSLLTVEHQGNTYREVSAYLETGWGDVVVAVALDSARREAPGLPTVDDVVRLARSVAPATEAEWAAFVAGAR